MHAAAAIPLIAGQDMDMHVRHYLPGSGKMVPANVKAIRVQHLTDAQHGLSHCAHKTQVTLLVHVKYRIRVCPWDNNGMTFRMRPDVKERYAGVVFVDGMRGNLSLCYAAEDAVVHLVWKGNGV